jgi:hypothetical protein
MKKGIIALVIMLLCAFVYQANAYDCTAKVGGVDTLWTTAGNWENCNSTYPQAGDNVDLLAVDLTWPTDLARIPDSGTLGTFTATTTGTLTIPLDNAGFHTNGASLYATTITAGTKGSAGMIQSKPTSASTDHIFTVNGTTCTGAASTTSGYAIAMTGYGSVGVFNIGLVGGGGIGAAALYSNQTSTVTFNSTLTGGAGRLSTGANMAGPTNVTFSANTNLTHHNSGTGGMAYAGPPPTTDNRTAANWEQWGTVKYAPQVAATDLKKDVVNGSVTGTLETTGGGAWGW